MDSGIPIDLTDEQFELLSKLAEQKGISLNEFINESILKPVKDLAANKLCIVLIKNMIVYDSISVKILEIEKLEKWPENEKVTLYPAVYIGSINEYNEWSNKEMEDEESISYFDELFEESGLISMSEDGRIVVVKENAFNKLNELLKYDDACMVDSCGEIKGLGLGIYIVNEDGSISPKSHGVSDIDMSEEEL